MATLFRGYEIILQGRDPRDAIFISSRACGVCGGVHATCSALAIEQAFGIAPPPMGIVARNLLLSVEYLYDHPIHLGLLAGPDFSEPAIRDTNPEIWEQAQSTRLRGRGIHGYEFMSELMSDLTPLTGKLYLEALHYTRVAREAYVLIGGKYPHPQTVVPGGVTTTIDTSDLNEIMLRMIQYFDYGRKVIAVWNDICDFFYEVNPKYRDIGTAAEEHARAGPVGRPLRLRRHVQEHGRVGPQRWAPPGVIVDGELVTASATMLNAGVEEFVEHAFYEEWVGTSRRTERQLPVPGGPERQPAVALPPLEQADDPQAGWHQLEGEVLLGHGPALGPSGDGDRRLRPDLGRRADPSLPRFTVHRADRQEHQMDPAARRSSRTTSWSGRSRRPGAPSSATGHVPTRIIYTAAIAYDNLLIAYDLLKKGGPDAKMSVPYKVPKDHRIGMGLWSAGRGYLTHHLEMDNGVLENYQILTPSTWMASPKDPFGNPGPYEEGVMSTPLLENYEKPEDFKGIDILRAMRSFDPCMPCTTHIHTDHRTISREVVTCACGAEGDHGH